VARSILKEAGQNVARAVKVILDKLFPGGEEVAIVFGGAVFQKGADTTLIETVSKECNQHRKGLKFVRLGVEPVLGAVGFAFDDLGWEMSKEAWENLKTREPA
jgi:hypothetical protein